MLDDVVGVVEGGRGAVDVGCCWLVRGSRCQKRFLSEPRFAPWGLGHVKTFINCLILAKVIGIRWNI